MASNAAAPAGGAVDPESGSFMQRMLDGVERIGNKVPHPVLMFLYLIIGVIILSTVLDFFDVSVTDTVAVPEPVVSVPEYYEDTVGSVDAAVSAYEDPHFEIKEVTIPIRGLLTVDGIRFLFASFVANFQGFGVVAVTFIAMLGAGAAEGAGLMDALIRKLVKSAPAGLITFLIVLVGALSSVASDAGYLILIPLAAVAFHSLGRHPLAGMAAGFAGVAATFAVNVIPQPTDAMLTEIANESIQLVGGEPMSILNGYYFGVASMLLMCVVATIITEKVIEPRLGPWNDSMMPAGDDSAPAAPRVDEAADSRGLRYALFGFLGVIALIVLLTAPSGAPLRDPVNGDILGTTPFMDSLLFLITLTLLVAGVAYGIGAGTVKKADDVIAAITKTFNGLGGLIFMLLMISQFIAHFNYSNLPDYIGVKLAGFLERANVSALVLLVGFILVIFLLDFIIPGAIPAWAIFAPVFIPVFFRLDVAPQTLLAAYRIGDSPVNTLTPLMVYFPFIVTIAQRYKSDSGIGSIIALMIPYAVIMGIIWIIFFILWFVLGIPLGPGYPIELG
ncbi:MAG: AbgT family transporter [Thermomicrobiales bacterium]|nr:AbgT family transporter [Thermomicrobiales bacterium]